MNTEQILKIAKHLLDIENAFNEDEKKSRELAYRTIEYVMTDDRAIKNGMDAVSPELRFDNVLSCVDPRIDERHAYLVGWVHMIIVNMVSCENIGLIEVK